MISQSPYSFNDDTMRRDDKSKISIVIRYDGDDALEDILNQKLSEILHDSNYEHGDKDEDCFDVEEEGDDFFGC